MPVGLCRYNFTYDNWGSTPGQLGTSGTAVTPGASNAEGSWTQVASSANIAQDCYWILLRVVSGALAGTAKMHLLDVGVDPAGGTSYTERVANIICGGSGIAAAVKPGRYFSIPLFIKAGSSVAVRVQGSAATAGTVVVQCKFYGQPTRPENAPVGMHAETLGTISGSLGESFTPGNGSFGTWVSLGTLARACWWFLLGVQVNDSTSSNEASYVELAYGDSTNKHLITKAWYVNTTNEETMDVFANMTFMENFCPLPAGTELWVRGMASDPPDTGYNAAVVAIGG